MRRAFCRGFLAVVSRRSSILSPAEPLTAARGGERWVLLAARGDARLELPDGGSLPLPLPAGAELSGSPRSRAAGRPQARARGTAGGSCSSRATRGGAGPARAARAARPGAAPVLPVDQAAAGSPAPPGSRAPTTARSRSTPRPGRRAGARSRRSRRAARAASSRSPAPCSPTAPGSSSGARSTATTTRSSGACATASPGGRPSGSPPTIRARRGAGGGAHAPRSPGRLEPLRRRRLPPAARPLRAGPAGQWQGERAARPPARSTLASPASRAGRRSSTCRSSPAAG